MRGEETGSVEVGIMVETPAAAIRAADIAPEVAFFSMEPTISSSTPWPRQGQRASNALAERGPSRGPRPYREDMRGGAGGGYLGWGVRGGGRGSQP